MENSTYHRNVIGFGPDSYFTFISVIKTLKNKKRMKGSMEKARLPLNTGIISTSNRIPTRRPIVMYASCHGATIVMTNHTNCFTNNVALHATMVSDITIAQTDVTIAAP